MSNLLFDLETNGLLSTPWEPNEDPVSKIHCAVTIDVDTKEVRRFRPHQCGEELLDHLDTATCLYGHNIVEYDLPVLEELRGWRPRYEVDLVDTTIWARMAYPIWRILNYDRAHGLDRDLGDVRHKHSLEAWGIRMGGEGKGSYGKDMEDPWAAFSEEMLDYCEQDVKVNWRLIQWLRLNSGYSEESAVLESNFQAIMRRQRVNGVRIDVEKAESLAMELRAERDDPELLLKEAFPPWYEANGKITVPKRSMTRTKGQIAPLKVEEGCPYQKLKIVEFNANSGAHITKWLKKKYDWQPTEFSKKSGLPSTKREIMKDLPWPEAQAYAKVDELQKKIGLISDGQKSWLKMHEDGILHGRVDGLGTATGRCAHSNPNCGQVPKVGKPHGRECRELFSPTRPGWVQVGCDASALEGCMQGHFMGAFDGGKFIDLLMEGDYHSDFQGHTGLYYRDNQKTLTYAYTYGAFDYKLGTIVIFDWNMAYQNGLTTEPPPKLTKAKALELGQIVRAKLERGVKALGSLKAILKIRKEEDGFIKGLDGRRIYLASEHSAMNYLFQGAGAIVMKKALLICDRELQRQGLVPKEDYEFMLNVHDEWQMECKPELADTCAQVSEAAITAAGEYFNLRCPLTGEAKVGNNWSETH